MKIIAFYLPQFHSFKENDEWWGKGFTEWTNVKNAKPLFKGHYQPRIPLNKNYYNLTNVDTLKWQADIAKKYGIYGFCYYHYWFDGHMLMEKPMELMLANEEVDLPFCICWANENWTKAWAQHSKKVLISQTYGDRSDWEKHFYYLLPFFMDKRYIYKDEMPIFVIYRPELIPTLRPMLEFWDKLAKKNGLKGIIYMYQQHNYDHQTADTGDLFSYAIEYEPGRVKGYYPKFPKKEQQVCSPLISFRRGLNLLVNKLHLKQTRISSVCYSYDDAWKRILNIQPADEKVMPGAFVDWDNTPRYKSRASIYQGVTPEKFERYLTQQICHARDDYKKDMIFMFAWNEWGEGGYLEPDEKYGYGMLEAVHNALDKTGELEN